MSGKAEKDLLVVRLLPIQKRCIAQIAGMEGESMATVVRRLIKQEAIRRSLWPADLRGVAGDDGDVLKE
jgi:hypothetical protein